MEKKSRLRFSRLFIGLGSLIVIIAMFLTDPDSGLIQGLPFGGNTVTYLLFVASSIVGIGILYLSVRACFDYVDPEELYKKIKTEPLAASLFVVARSIYAVGIAIVIYAFVK